MGFLLANSDKTHIPNIANEMDMKLMNELNDEIKFITQYTQKLLQ